MKHLGLTPLLLFLLAGNAFAELDKLPRQNFAPRPRDEANQIQYEPWLFRPTNVYQLEEKLPVAMRRVAVLPLTAGNDNEFGRDSLEAVLLRELGKCHAFEVVAVTAAQVMEWTGRARWTAEEKLPVKLLAQIHEHTGGDAVLFARLTQYRAYRPLTVGWSLKLVELSSGKILWAADEVFDAGDPKVVRAAGRYAARQIRESSTLGELDGILLSPSRFGQYAAGELLATLPGR